MQKQKTSAVGTTAEPSKSAQLLTWAVIIVGTVLVLRTSFKEA